MSSTFFRYHPRLLGRRAVALDELLLAVRSRLEDLASIDGARTPCALEPRERTSRRTRPCLPSPRDSGRRRRRRRRSPCSRSSPRRRRHALEQGVPRDVSCAYSKNASSVMLQAVDRVPPRPFFWALASLIAGDDDPETRVAEAPLADALGRRGLEPALPGSRNMIDNLAERSASSWSSSLRATGRRSRRAPRWTTNFQTSRASSQVVKPI